MSSSELGPEDPAQEQPAEAAGAAAADAEQQPVERVAVETAHAPIEVGLERSVRYGRILIAGVVLGAVIGALAAHGRRGRRDRADARCGAFPGALAPRVTQKRRSNRRAD